jgi:dTDP-4-amino-4,6-dideoxygalactose transaminase
VRDNLVPVMRPHLATLKQLAPYLKRIDQNHIYSNQGPLVRELENSYANYLKIDPKLVVAVANATLAIQGLVANSKVHDWLAPNYTFTASGLAVLNASRTLHLCDVRMSDWKIDLDLICSRHQDFGLIPVMPFGMPIDFNSYFEYKTIIIDAAASLGQPPPDFMFMKKDWAVVYSLHATKVLGAGEGGLAICGNLEMAENLRSWINFGFVNGRISDIQGTNGKMSEIHAAYGLFSLTNIDIEMNDWIEAQEFIETFSKQNNWISHINQKASFQPYWIAQFESKLQKKNVIAALSNARIQSREWWPIPLNIQKAFIGSARIDERENAERLSSTHLGLPMFRGISRSTIKRIINTINNELSKN